MPYIPTEEVESSNIERIGYHRKQQILRIIFQGNRAYDYPMVTEREFRDLMAADSKGSFFNRRIKPMYGHRTPREIELVEPCCEHDEPNPTCTEECLPCNEWCCPGAPGASQEEIATAIASGRAFGAAVGGAPPSEVPSGHPGHQTCDPECETREPTATEAEAGGAAPDVVDKLVAEVEKSCLHPGPDREERLDGSGVACGVCGADLSESGDCPHGAGGRTCEEGCGCIPCHANEEEETNGNSD